jgi:DNA-binding transcriptional ArsR family regulator
MKPVKNFTESARLLKVLGHPLRLKIVCGLLGEPANLSRIARNLDVPVSTLAQHLGVLRAGGVLDEHKEGVEVIFSVSDRRVPGILGILCDPTTGKAKLPRWDWEELGAKS